jgi:hypothetical protein
MCCLSSEFSETGKKECVNYYGDGKCNHLSNYGSDCDDIEYVPISELQSTLARVTGERDELISIIKKPGQTELEFCKKINAAISRIEEVK